MRSHNAGSKHSRRWFYRVPLVVALAAIVSTVATPLPISRSWTGAPRAGGLV